VLYWGEGEVRWGGEENTEVVGVEKKGGQVLIPFEEIETKLLAVGREQLSNTVVRHEEE